MYARGFLKSIEYPKAERGARIAHAPVFNRSEPDKLRATRLWQQAANRGFAPAQRASYARPPRTTQCASHLGTKLRSFLSVGLMATI